MSSSRGQALEAEESRRIPEVQYSIKVDQGEYVQGFSPVGDKPSNPKAAVGIGKVSMSVLPTPVLAELGVALTEGGCKYGRHNYRATGARASTYYDATIRHLMAWWEGEDTDPDSGLSHVTKAISSLMVLRDTMIRGNMTDDRPPATLNFLPHLNRCTQEILNKHGHREVPHHYTSEDMEAVDVGN